MSDIEKAEELLKKFLRIYDPSRFESVIDKSLLREAVEEYFKKPVFIVDTFKRRVEISIDDDGDLSFDWVDDYEVPESFFPPDELVRGLKELGVIE